jgi:malate synthase
MTTLRYGPGIEITGRVTPEYAGILTPEALGFAARLQRAFGGRRGELLSRRAARQRELDAGKLPDFLPETRAIREARWTSGTVASRLPARSIAR